MAMNKSKLRLKNIENISQEVYEIGQIYFEERRKSRRSGGAKWLQLGKVFYFMFLTAATPSEMMNEHITLAIHNGSDYTSIKLLEGIHEVDLPVLSTFEQEMWDIITEYGEMTNYNEIFGLKWWAKNLHYTNFSHLISQNFKGIIIKQTGEEIFTGIPPALVRNMRYVDWVVGHNIPLESVVKWCRLKDDRPLRYNPIIGNYLKGRSETKILNAYNLLQRRPIKNRYLD